MEIKDLDKQLSENKIGRLYFFYGPEQFLMESKIKAMKKLLIPKDFSELNFISLDGKKASVSDISREVMSLPVMAERKMVVIRDALFFDNAKARDFSAICELLLDLPDYLCVVFTKSDFDKKKEKNLDTFKKHGAIIKFDLLSPIQLTRWLEKLFEKSGKAVLSSNLSTMVELCGQNMSSLFNEYQKLLSFVGDRSKITEDDIRAVVAKSTETRIFDLVDSIAMGKTQKVFDELTSMRASGENPSTVMSLITSRLGDLLMVKQLSLEKLSRDKIAGYFEPRKPDFVIDKLLEQSKRFSEKRLIEMTLKGPEHTAAVRTGLLDKWLAVEMYVSSLIN